MPYAFTNPAAYPARSGSLFLGLDPATNAPVGITTERHAITIAGSGSGKGAAFLIPNALRWPHNLLVVDPKGENAKATWQARAALGQTVAVLDPFNVAAVPDGLRASFNPLTSIDPQSLTAREDIRVIADGLVKRHKADDGEWYDGAVMILAGVMADVLANAPADLRTFAAVRSQLLKPDADLHADAQHMAQSAAFGGLARSAGVSIMAAIDSDKGADKSFLSMARRATDWMDSPSIASVLASSSFDLADLKTGKLSLFLVLPPQYLDEYGTFLRLFVRCAINAMMRDGAKTEGKCLFLLDEFYSLGKLDIIAKSAGLMRGYGLHLWPFLQDLGQLQSLYTPQIAETFFGNADASIFFGNSDQLTLEYVSKKVGNLTPEEVVASPPEQRAYSGWRDNKLLESEAESRERLQVEQANRRAYYDHAMRIAGRPRITPDQVAQLVGKKDGDTVARSAIVFAKGGDVLNVRLQPYFAPERAPAPQPPAAPPAKQKSKGLGGAKEILALCAVLLLGLWVFQIFDFWIAAGVGLAAAALKDMTGFRFFKS